MKESCFPTVTPGARLQPLISWDLCYRKQARDFREKEKEGSFFLSLLSVFAWVAFLCSATDFYPILKKLIWDFCPSLDLSETGGIWFMRRGQAGVLTERLHGPSTFSNHTKVLRTSSEELDTAPSPALNTETKHWMWYKILHCLCFPSDCEDPISNWPQFSLN